MSGPFLTLVIESLVVVLLALTICYCLILNRRLTRLRADESIMRATIAELVTATVSAERAIAGLKTVVGECDQTLGDRLRTAERFGADFERALKRGEEILARIIQIAEAANGVDRAKIEPVRIEAANSFHAGNGAGRRTTETIVAAQAIASRTRLRAGEAA